MVKLNGTLPDNYNRSLRNRTIDNHIEKKMKRRPGRPPKQKKVIVQETSEPKASVPDAGEQLVLSVKQQYNLRQEMLKSKGKLKGM